MTLCSLCSVSSRRCFVSFHCPAVTGSPSHSSSTRTTMARLHRAQLLLLFIEPLSCCCLPSLPPLHLKTCLSGIAATGIYVGMGNAPPPESTSRAEKESECRHSLRTRRRATPGSQAIDRCSVCEWTYCRDHGTCSPPRASYVPPLLHR